jgi:hypothetical protein
LRLSWTLQGKTAIQKGSLVIRDDLHPAIIGPLLRAAISIHRAGGLFSNPGEFPAPKRLEFPLSPEAARHWQDGPPWLQRFLPFWIATLIDRLKALRLPIVIRLIPRLKVIPPTFRWRMPIFECPNPL